MSFDDEDEVDLDALLEEAEDGDQEIVEDGDGEEEENIEVVIQNLYFNSKGLRADDPDEAVKGFKEVLEKEPEKGEWGFKALKELVKLQLSQKKYKEMMENYKTLLTYVKHVGRAQSEKAINGILDRATNCDDVSLLQDFYESTLGTLKEAKNDRLWFKTQLKLGKLFLERSEFGKIPKVLRELYASCKKEDGTDDDKKNSQIVEINALEVQMCNATKNTKRLKELYEKSMVITNEEKGLRFIDSAVDAEIKAIIRECGGKMHMSDGHWNQAYTDFFEAFKCYDQAGKPRRVHCLKYVVLANLMSLSKINPFDSDEAKSYKNDNEISAFINLVAAYEDNDIHKIEKIISENRSSILDDPFIRQYIEQLIRQVRTKVLLKLLEPYTRITIDYICKELNATEEEVESLLIALILDNKLRGHIDQINKSLTVVNRGKTMSRDYLAMEKWAKQVEIVVGVTWNVKLKQALEQ